MTLPDKPITEREFLQTKFILRPGYLPVMYNGSNEPCDMLHWPCACGAWHGNDANPYFAPPPPPLTAYDKLMLKELDPPGTNLDAVRQIFKESNMSADKTDFDVFKELDDIEERIEGIEKERGYTSLIRENIELKMNRSYWNGFWTCAGLYFIFNIIKIILKASGLMDK